MLVSAPRGSLRCFRLTLVALVALGVGVRAVATQDASVGFSPPSPPNPIIMKTYVIIFRQGPHKLTDADLARRQQEVSAWAREQNAAGHKLEPRILAPEVQRPAVNADGEQGIGVNAWPITALLFLQANDLSDAAKVAASHPAKHYNASVEVRPWAGPAAAPPVQDGTDIRNRALNNSR